MRSRESSLARTMRSLTCFVMLTLLVADACGETNDSPPDRQVAEWAILMGGSVRLVSEAEHIHEISELPATDFHLEHLNLVGTNISPPDLQRLAGLRRLKILNLPGPMWNPRAGSRPDHSRELSHLANINTLEQLTVSYSYLASIKLRDGGLEEIASLAPSLRNLSLENTEVRGHNLAPFTNLEALDLVYCPIDDDGLEELSGLVRLRTLLLRDALITDEGLRHLSGLVKLEHLDLGGTKITDVGVANLQEMRRLRKLNLLAIDLTDAGIRHLANMSQLEELNLYGTKVTNSGLATLSNLANLRQLDVRYSRASRAGVANLQLALPECEITFLDLSVRPSIPAEADRLLADSTPTRLIEWVHAMGGTALVEAGQLVEVSLASTSVTDRLIENLKGTTLRKLDLEGTEIGDIGVRHLKEMSRLRRLNLNGTMISDAGLEYLAGLVDLRELELEHTAIKGPGLEHLVNLNLETLSLSGSPVADQGLAHLAKLASLRRLELAYTDITDRRVSQLGSLAELKYLNLVGTDVGNDGLNEIGKMAGLTSLLLGYTRITDKGTPSLEHLSELRKLELIRTRVTDKSMAVIGSLTQLVDLDLDYTEIGDEGLIALEGLSKLERLSLDSTNVTDAAAAQLGGLEHLKQLNLYHTLMTEAGHERILNSIPNCEIIWDPLSSDPTRRKS
jgi:Leucine-rich repeat (LRR) protein